MLLSLSLVFSWAVDFISFLGAVVLSLVCLGLLYASRVGVGLWRQVSVSIVGLRLGQRTCRLLFDSLLLLEEVEVDWSSVIEDEVVLLLRLLASASLPGLALVT